MRLVGQREGELTSSTVPRRPSPALVLTRPSMLSFDDPSAYGYPQQQSQPQGNMSGGGGGGGGGGNPLWGGFNDPTTQMGVQFGKSAVAAGHDYMEKTVSLAPPLLLTDGLGEMGP